VVVHNEETVVIGGMIGQDTTNSDTRCRYSATFPPRLAVQVAWRDPATKTNLFIFITPRIVENPAELGELFHKKRDAVEKVHKSARRCR
jgi:general secretion pathway protein D